MGLLQHFGSFQNAGNCLQLVNNHLSTVSGLLQFLTYTEKLLKERFVSHDIHDGKRIFCRMLIRSRKGWGSVYGASLNHNIRFLLGSVRTIILEPIFQWYSQRSINLGGLRRSVSFQIASNKS